MSTPQPRPGQLVEATTHSARKRHLAREADLSAGQINLDGRAGTALCHSEATPVFVMDQDRYAADRARWSYVPVKPITDMPLCRKCAKQSTAEARAS